MRTRFVYTLPALALAVVAVVLAVVGLMRYEDKSESPAVVSVQPGGPEAPQAPQAPTHTYLFAKEDIKAGQELTPELFTEVETTAVIESALAKSDVPFGDVLKAPVKSGMPLSQRLFDNVSPVNQVLSASIRAMAFDLNPLSSVGGLLRPGDAVDIVAIFRGDSKDTASSVRLLNNVSVLAVRGVIEPGAAPSEDDKRRDATMVLAVPEEDVEKLALATAEASLKFIATSGVSSVEGLAEGEEGEPLLAVTKPANEPEPAVAFLSEIRPVSPDAIKKEKAKKKQLAKEQQDPGHKVQIFEGSGARTTYVR